MWRKIPSTNYLYECNKKGEIRRIGGSILSPKIKSNGYLEVNLYPEKNRSRSFYVHRLVAEAWLGVIPPRMAVNHTDADKKNNNLSNLEIVTYSENSKHAFGLGLIKPKPMPGELHPGAKTNDKEVLKIREEHGLHHSIKRLMNDYPHLSKGTLTKIVYNQTWKHV